MLKLYIQFSNDFDIDKAYIVYKWLHPLRVFLKLSRTLRFEYLMIILELYTSKFWTQPYFEHNISKYEVILPFVLKKVGFLFLNT
jgi:hypothetical protein